MKLRTYKNNYVVRRLTGVNDPTDNYFETLIEAKIFQHHNGGSISERITTADGNYYWAKVRT
jgi:hypothetical protein